MVFTGHNFIVLVHCHHSSRPLKSYLVKTKTELKGDPIIDIAKHL